MRRPDLFKLSTAGLATSMLGGAGSTATPTLAPRGAAATAETLEFSVSIREYLSREARKITNVALSEYTGSAAYHRIVAERAQLPLPEIRAVLGD